MACPYASRAPWLSACHHDGPREQRRPTGEAKARRGRHAARSGGDNLGVRHNSTHARVQLCVTAGARASRRSAVRRMIT